MTYRARRSVLTLHRKIAKDATKTLKANAAGGRYHKPTLSEKIVAAYERARG